ncbi:MAG TPA: DUF1553 domain-containing protein [Gemmataceae bacterium]|nr:DUF1553 domain-containing protein [Gemmataceae bacterium]
MLSRAALLPLTLGIAAAFARPGTAAGPIEFNRDIRPILTENCFGCHGPDSASRKAGLRLDQREAALKAGAIVPGDPDASELVRRIFETEPSQIMPPPKTKKTLSPQQKELLRAWVAAGAPYQPHWSFIPVPKTVAVPRPPDPHGWGRNPIDAFILDRLQREKIEPAVEASRETWLRRVTFDLTGLPPTIEEIDAFLADQSEDAYHKVVNRLLASPAYGERMANDWLDVARYADTFGYQADRDTHVWPWRDWVIRAFNANLPYDQFILWQTAGDLLENPTREQRLATAFNRLHRQTNEGGSIEEEFRVEYVADRLRTNGMAFLGLTLECARCHDHKYDPITMREYYQLSAFFNNIDEHGLYSHFTETAPTPALLLYEGDQEVRHRDLVARIQAKEAELRRIREAARARFRPETVAVAVPPPAAAYSFEGVKAHGDYRPVPGKVGQAIEFGGDDAYVCKGAGAFGRTTPFTLALWVKPTQHRPRMVVVHRSRAAEDSAFRGYALVLDNGRPTFSLVHFWPGNALQVKAKRSIPLGEWTHLAVTYDGSSRAAGVRVYVNGTAVEYDVVRDRLTRDIIHRKEWGDYDVDGVQLALGARFRDVGFQKGAVDEFRVFDRDLTPLEVAAVGGFPVPAAEADVFEHYLLRRDEEYQKVRGELQQLRHEENELIGQVRQVMVMQEMPGRRPTYVLARGAYDAPREPVQPDTPAAILPFPAEYPRNRLGLARWLLDDRNPLTARVTVNRFWQIFFGRGLVPTAEDFGAQGQPPSHPELLDWLARYFMDHGWNVHELCRLIVLSATYRQSSVPRDPRLYTSDPDNRLLARGPRHRLAAEQLRDNALAVSGLLVRRLGGPSVMPYQPAGLWEESGTGKVYRQSKGEGLYRRSLYTFWRRTAPPPSMTTFDAPTREFCLARRERTATPLQALVLLNDPQFVEAARVLAEKLIHQHGDDVAARVRTAFRLLTSRQPSSRELEVLLRLHREQRQRFQMAPDKAAAFLDTGEAPRDRTLDAADHAAMTVVVQALMNFDECVTKR